jgi:hypothetical protein
MGSTGKKKTTMAKLNRETKLREKRAQKHARKAARKLEAAADPDDAALGDEDLGGAVDDLDVAPADGDDAAPAEDAVDGALAGSRLEP